MKIVIELEVEGEKVVSVEARRVGAKVSQAVEKAREFLTRSLADGPKMSIELFEEAEEEKLGRYSLYVASRELGVIKRPLGYRACDGWLWELGK